jgi:hypothetical protein
MARQRYDIGSKWLVQNQGKGALLVGGLDDVLDLLTFFGGQKAMIESPLIQKVRADANHELILDALKDRFGSTPRDVTKRLREIINEKELRRLNRIANKCADLDAFRAALLG